MVPLLSVISIITLIHICVLDQLQDRLYCAAHCLSFLCYILLTAEQAKIFLIYCYVKLFCIILLYFYVKYVLKYQPRGLFDITKDCIGVYLKYIHIYLHYFIFLFCCPNCETVNINTKICMLLFCEMPFFIP